jgi:hypothetical protein
MAADLSITNAAASAMCDALVDRIDSGGAGTLRIYAATRAVTTDTAVGAQVVLATLTFGATAFGAASNGVATANSITQDSSADATDTASWFRIFNNGQTTAQMDGNVGTSASDLILNTVSIVTGAVVSISAGSVTVPLT